MWWRMENKAFIYNGIKLLLEKNYKKDVDSIDLESEIDSKLSFRENWMLIKKKFVGCENGEG